MSEATQELQGSSFDYVKLSEIDPNVKPFPVGPYNLEVVRTKMSDFVYKNGPNTGKDGSVVNITFQVVDHPEHSGRRVRDKVFLPDERSFRDLRRLMDATGIEQVEGEALSAWLDRLPVEKARVKYFVKQGTDTNRDGQEIPVNTIDWRSASVAD